MSREKNENAVKSEMEGIRKGYIYTSALLFPIFKKKKKRDSGTVIALTGTGTTYAKRDSGQSVPVPHLLVPIPSGGC